MLSSRTNRTHPTRTATTTTTAAFCSRRSLSVERHAFLLPASAKPPPPIHVGTPARVLPSYGKYLQPTCAKLSYTIDWWCVPPSARRKIPNKARQLVKPWQTEPVLLDAGAEAEQQLRTTTSYTYTDANHVLCVLFLVGKGEDSRILKMVVWRTIPILHLHI